MGSSWRVWVEEIHLCSSRTVGTVLMKNEEKDGKTSQDLAVVFWEWSKWGCLRIEVRAQSVLPGWALFRNRTGRVTMNPREAWVHWYWLTCQWGTGGNGYWREENTTTAYHTRERNNCLSMQNKAMTMWCRRMLACNTPWRINPTSQPSLALQCILNIYKC